MKVDKNNKYFREICHILTVVITPFWTTTTTTTKTTCEHLRKVQYKIIQKCLNVLDIFPVEINFFLTNIISIVKPTRCIKVPNLFYFGMTLYMFRTVFPSIIRSSGLYIQLSDRYCYLLASKQTAVSVWQMPVAVFTLLNTWGWTERPSETCTASFQYIINLISWCI